jgi:methylmalonyl-CoA mutase N-terminal domain/subunit
LRGLRPSEIMKDPLAVLICIGLQPPMVIRKVGVKRERMPIKSVAISTLQFIMFSVKRASSAHAKNAGRSKMPEIPDRASPRGRPYYRQEDTAEIDYLSDISFPGQPPYVRGITPAMYRTDEWELFRCVDSPDIESARREINALAANGLTSFSLSFSPFQATGSMHPAGLEWNGGNYAGLNIHTARDFKRLLHPVRTLDCKIGFHSGYSAPEVMAMYMSYLHSGKHPLAKMHGFVENNVFEAPSLAGSSVLPLPLDLSFNISISLVDYLMKEAPDFSPLTISGYNLKEAGSSGAQEVAFVIASAVTYLEHVESAGIDISALLKKLNFILGVGTDVPLEVAKFRAARRLWYSTVRSRFPGLDDELLRFRLMARTSGSVFTESDPEINAVRTTIQMIAAVLGGAQCITVGAPATGSEISSSSILNSLMMHRILSNESSITDTIDPLAGSYYVESMTNDIERTARSYLMKFRDLGNFEAAVETGYMHSEVRASSIRMREQLSSGERLIVERNVLAAKRGGKHPVTGSASAHTPRGSNTAGGAPGKHTVRSDKYLEAIYGHDTVDARLIGLLTDAFAHGHSLTDVTWALSKLSENV